MKSRRNTKKFTVRECSTKFLIRYGIYERLRDETVRYLRTVVNTLELQLTAYRNSTGECLMCKRHSCPVSKGGGKTKCPWILYTGDVCTEGLGEWVLDKYGVDWFTNSKITLLRVESLKRWLFLAKKEVERRDKKTRLRLGGDGQNQ